MLKCFVHYDLCVLWLKGVIVSGLAEAASHKQTGRKPSSQVWLPVAELIMFCCV